MPHTLINNQKCRYLVSKSPQFEIHRNVVATPTVVKMPVPPNSVGSISGCLYKENGDLLTISQRLGGSHGDYFPSTNDNVLPEQCRHSLPALHGRCIYLGHYMPHYGHFLVEMLSTFWMFDSFKTFDHFVLHPFAFGVGKELPSYILDALRAFGMPPEKLFFIEGPTRLDEVLIPERLINFHHSANLHVRAVYRHLRDYYAADITDSINQSDCRYYVSRVKTSLGAGGRAIANEAFVESKLRRLGFSIVYPEELSFPEQIRLFANADVICGVGGSGMHNVLFMRKNALLIEIGDARTGEGFVPMQEICNGLSEVKAFFIPFNGRILDEGRQISWINVAATIEQVKTKLLSSGCSCLAGSPGGEPTLRKDNYSFFRGVQLICLSFMRIVKYHIKRLGR